MWRQERERALPRNCIALMNNIISENGEETPRCTNQRQDRAGGRERDGTQHWLPNYAFYHFSHNRVPPFFSCPVYPGSCSSTALMRKIKNNHKHVIFTSTDHQITSHCGITHNLLIMWTPHSHISKDLYKNNAVELICPSLTDTSNCAEN